MSGAMYRRISLILSTGKKNRVKRHVDTATHVVKEIVSKSKATDKVSIYRHVGNICLAVGYTFYYYRSEPLSKQHNTKTRKDRCRKKSK